MSIIGFILVVFEIILTIFNHYQPSKNDSQLLDGSVMIGDGPALLKANYHVVMTESRNC